MAFFDFLNKKAAKRNSIPREMLLRFMAHGQVMWSGEDTHTLLNDGFLNNHVVYTVQDWLSQKVGSAEPLVYEVKEEKAYKQYRSYLKHATYDSVKRAIDIRHKALSEVEGSDISQVLTQPNNMMKWYEFAYGYSVFKNMCGSSYFGATRDGISDPRQGAIRQMDLFPSHKMVITSGDRINPIKEYHLSSNPEVKIPVENVLQIRNFSPEYETETQWMYGLSKLYPLRKILQEYGESTESKVSLFQDKGIRDIIFPKGVTDPGEISITDAQSAEDSMNRKLTEKGGIITNSIELGVIRVGFSPVEMGILESQKILKGDFCAAWHIPAVIFDWKDSSTFNNLEVARRIAFTDAVLPELEQLKDGLNGWLVPSYTNVKQRYNNQKQNLVIDFDLEGFNELQEDKAKQVEWMSKTPLSANEIRRALRYDDSKEENADKIMIPTGFKLLEDMGLESFGSNPQDDTFRNEET
jgi:phage portal protein BeeE